MDLKLIEDLRALQRCGSYVRAAAERHVTHPAFGRRIRALQAWAGVPLVEPGRAPLRLTSAGQALLAEAAPLLAALEQARAGWQAGGTLAGASLPLRVGTGRTLARTLVADWLARHRAVWRGQRVEVVTRSMAEIAQVFERGEVDLLCCYEHAALSTGLAPQRFRYLRLAQDRLLPVSRADASGRPRHLLHGSAWIAYAPTLSLGRLLADHLVGAAADGRAAPAVVCDSADAMLELALKGLGMAWLPASLAAADIRRGLLVVLGGNTDQVPFEVRMYRPRARQRALVEAIWAASER